MKKLLGIVILSLLSFNINNVTAAERIVLFSCGTTGGSSEGITLSIDLDKSSMEFGLPKYKITSISDDVIIGGNCGIQQFSRIGKMAMIGGMTGVSRDVIPYGLSFGNRNYLQGLNLIGLRRKNIPNKDILSLTCLL